jgi:(4-(4-[2-(gamma-L-glutamylamino)ethyl]phenoxymethyl)furan-2-yl)methanamine synthase
MIGLDLNASDMAGWRMVSEFLAEKQLRIPLDACERLLSMLELPSRAPLIGAGAGRFLVEAPSLRLNRPNLGTATLFSCEKALQPKVAACAPAVAIATLAMENPA